jgi:outer membrane biosynthesis protein TonB
MNNKSKALYVGGLLALTISMTMPVMADEWNKRTEFTFSAPVEIPGKVLAAGKYVFELAESDSDRSIVQVYSIGSNGKQNLIATVLAIPDYVQETPDKTIINFDEQHSGSPEAIHSWFYPGDNTGWQFVYPASERVEPSAATTPAPPPVAPAAAPSPSPAPEVQAAPEPTPQIQETSPSAEVTVTEEEVVLAPADEPAQLAPDTDQQESALVLPQTGGHSELGIMTCFVMLIGGTVTLFASRRRSLA